MNNFEYGSKPYDLNHFGMWGIDVPPYKELPSPPKPSEIQISVCLTTYNRPKELITTCIDSILTQDFPKESYEVILVDDASEGEGLENYYSAVDELIKKYSEHNFRAYHTDFTRCYNDPHTFNVAFKRSLGWILMMDQTDDIHEGETLEATWRHQNMIDNLGLCPAHYALDGEGNRTEWPRSFYPGEFGLSMRADRVRKIKGRNETIKGMANTAIIDFLLPLNLVFAEDRTIRTVHRETPRQMTMRSGYPLRWDEDKYVHRRPDGTWTDGDWGSLTPEEEANVRMTEAMRRVM